MKKLNLLFITTVLFQQFIFAQKAVPDFTVTDIYGHTHKLYSDYLNNSKYVFIDFFSVGCPSCQELSPVLDTVYRYFGCNYNDVVFLGVDAYYTESDSLVFGFTKNYKMTFPAVSGKEGGGSEVFTDYGLNYVPYKVLIDPTGKIVADYPLEYTVKYYKDTLLNTGLKLSSCSGNDFWFYSLLSENDSIVGDIDETNNTVNVIMPNGTDLTQLRANFIAESNSVVKVNGTEQISGETVNDFSSGSLTYDITSEDGNTKQWTVNVTSSTISEILKNKIKIYPNPVKNDFFIDTDINNIPEIYSEIINTNGETVKKFRLTDSNTLINISNLSSGIYFLKITINKNSFFKKIIKL